MSNKIKCSHILVDKQSEAMKLYEEIKSGKKFGAIARDISTVSYTHLTLPTICSV